MRKLILIILLFICGQVNAQWNNCALGSVGFCSSSNTAQPAYTGPGDISSGYYTWYGLRAYSAAYATAQNPIANLRNTSTAETCIAPAATTGGIGTMQSCSGSSNGVSLATFCATGCAVSQLYDQSGGNNCSAAPCHATQATAATQPTITLNCIGTLPCLTGNGSQWFATSIGALSPSITITSTSKRTASFTSQGDTFSSNDGAFYTSTANTYGGFWGSSCSATASDSVVHNIATVFQGATGALIAVDGTVTGPSGCSGTTVSSTGWNIFAQQGGFDILTGSIMEVGMKASALNSAALISMCHNQFGYWGTATSC